MNLIDDDRQLKYTITPESNKVCYLILHLGVPVGGSSSSVLSMFVENKIAKQLGIKVFTVRATLGSNDTAHGIPRYFIRFPYFRRNDVLASHIADSLLVAASVTFGPFMDESDDVSVFRIPHELVKKRDSIAIGEIFQIERLRHWHELGTQFSESLISASSSFSEYRVEAAWKLLPLLLNNDALLRAYRFIKTSQDNFYVWSGEIDEIMAQADTTASNIFEQSRLERALEDSFKAVEAIVGDPPKDDRKFRKKLLAAGVNPDKEFGLDGKPISQVIREMNIVRDKKAAHGSTQNRKITVGEVLTYQKCARYIVLIASETFLGSRLL